MYASHVPPYESHGSADRNTNCDSHDFAYFGQQVANPDDARSVTRNIRNLPLAFPLRVKYLYSNLIYTVATHLVEVKIGKGFNDFPEERFFGQLSMGSTSLQPAEARRKGHGDRIATGYVWDKASASYRWFQWPTKPEAQGAGSFVSSVRDLIKWAKAPLARVCTRNSCGCAPSWSRGGRRSLSRTRRRSCTLLGSSCSTTVVSGLSPMPGASPGLPDCFSSCPILISVPVKRGRRLPHHQASLQGVR